MNKQVSRYGLRWIFPLLGFAAWFSIGCNPQSLSMMLGAINGDCVDPEYKLFTAKEELTLVILAHFDRPEYQPDLEPVGGELTDKLKEYILKRCQDNKHKVKIVPNVKVQSYVSKATAEGDYSPIDVGRHFKADFVLDLAIQSCQILEKKTYPPLYNGQATINLTVHKMKDGEKFTKLYHGAYPGEGVPPVDASSMRAEQFRGYFMNVLARDISKILIAYPQQERNQMNSY